MTIMPNNSDADNPRMEGNTIVWSAKYRYPLGPSKIWVSYTEDENGARTQPMVTTNAFNLF